MTANEPDVPRSVEQVRLKAEVYAALVRYRMHEECVRTDTKDKSPYSISREYCDDFSRKKRDADRYMLAAAYAAEHPEPTP